MSWLKTIFGPSRDDVWQQLAVNVGGRFRPGTLMNSPAVQTRTGDSMITLDSYYQSTGSSSRAYTRIRAPWFNPEGFRFTISRVSAFSGLWKAMGGEDIEVGHPGFDRNFVIKSNAPRRLSVLLESPDVRRLIESQPKLRLTVKAKAGLFTKYPAGVDELNYEVAGTLKDLQRLGLLFELFAEVLRLLETGYETDEVRIQLRRLRTPPGKIIDKHFLWQGDWPRRNAAEALGKLGDPVTVGPLAAVLQDDDVQLRVRAVTALASIGDEAAVAPLIPLLGDRLPAIAARAAGALTALGQPDLVGLVRAALSGDPDGLKAYEGPYRGAIIAALGHALEGPSGAEAAGALAAIHAVEALPRLRDVGRTLGARHPAAAPIQAAITTLEARSSLPRAATPTDPSTETLPRATPDQG